jgi:hypothetical protein
MERREDRVVVTVVVVDEPTHAATAAGMLMQLPLAPAQHPAFSSPATAPRAGDSNDDEYTILAGRLFDPYAKKLVKDQLVRVSSASGLILDVRPFAEEDVAVLDLASPDVLDLRGLTVLPGLVDVHVHRASALRLRGTAAQRPSLCF